MVKIIVPTAGLTKGAPQAFVVARAQVFGAVEARDAATETACRRWDVRCGHNDSG